MYLGLTFVVLGVTHKILYYNNKTIIYILLCLCSINNYISNNITKIQNKVIIKRC